MDWYSSALTPYNCLMVNTSISVSCTNLNSPSFPLTITTTQIAKFNPKLTPSKTVALLVRNILLADTQYVLQLHLYNVIPNIQHMSPNIEMYTVSYNGLIYETNTNFGAVINNPPQTNLMTVSVLNDLSAESPGSSVTLRAEVTIGQAISTSLSTFIFIMQYPFTFSVGSIPLTIESTSYATNPISLYSKPTISSYEVLTPNIFRLIFSEKFVVGRKFIVEVPEKLLRSTRSAVPSLSRPPTFLSIVSTITPSRRSRPSRDYTPSRPSATPSPSHLDSPMARPSRQLCSFISQRTNTCSFKFRFLTACLMATALW